MSIETWPSSNIVPNDTLVNICWTGLVCFAHRYGYTPHLCIYLRTCIFHSWARAHSRAHTFILFYMYIICLWLYDHSILVAKEFKCSKFFLIQTKIVELNSRMVVQRQVGIETDSFRCQAWLLVKSGPTKSSSVMTMFHSLKMSGSCNQDNLQTFLSCSLFRST